MAELYQQYFPLLIFLSVAFVFSGAAVLASRIVAPYAPDNEKVSPYECGFDPFHNAHSRFRVRYYLVALLFILFDLEIAFLFPWAIAIADIGMFGFWSAILFLAILTVGFIYEWSKGALEWE